MWDLDTIQRMNKQASEEGVKEEHRLVRVWDEGPSKGFTYAFRCSCGEKDSGYVLEHYARDGHTEHVEEMNRERPA